MKRPCCSHGCIPSTSWPLELAPCATSRPNDLPLNFHPAAIRASAVLNRSQTLDHRMLEFSGFIQGGGLVAPPEFTNEIGTLLPIAP
ncbi:hypothetical protein AMK05_PC00346 (plasmid) [Rhizobium sp. N324]|nr:hypothetical protein AMK05_PC00346 [Rhizobium sp. N324]